MINIVVKDSKKFVGISAFISFPYSVHYVNLMRAQPNRYWHADDKCWEIPYSNLPLVLEKINDSDYKLTIESNAQKEIDNINNIHIPENYSFKTKPFEHQIEGIEYGLNHKKFLLADEQGCGKALSLMTKVYTPSGYKLMKDICVGDFVFNKQGKPVKVSATYVNENVNMCRITFSDNVSVECCEDHLWEIKCQGNSKVVDTKWFFSQDQFGQSRNEHLRTKTSYKYYIDRCEPVQFNSQKVPLNPYVLGCLLGDGGISQNSVNITIVDSEIYNRITKELPEDYILSQPESMKPITYTITKSNRSSSKENKVKTVVRQLGLLGTTSHTKFIPDVYKYNSVDVRLAVVQGLIDTDGYAMKENNLTYTTVSIQLAEDMRFMLESLGCIVNWREHDASYNGKVTGKAYTLNIRCDDPSLLCTLTKKKSRLRPRKFKPRRYITNIERIGKGVAKCITVDDVHGLYLIEHFIVTHNTKQMVDLAVINKQLYGYKHCLIVACVNGLKYNWQEEVGTHSDETGYILGTRITKTGKTTIGSNKDRLDDLQHIENIKSYFIITNIETLRYTTTEKVPCKKKAKGGVTRYKKVTKFPIVEELQKLIRKGEISMIVADEIHKCFEGGTPVLTDKGLVPIVDIITNRCYKIATRLDDGTIDYVYPTNYFSNPKPIKMLHIELIHSVNDNNFGVISTTETIICTPNHKFLMSDGSYKEVQDINIGEPLFNGFIKHKLEVFSNNCVRGDYVYDLEIPETHNYILFENIVVHNCKDSTSLQGRALLSLNADSVIALTGTPLMNNAIDLYTPLKFIGMENHSLFAFKGHYCICGGFGGHQIVGYKNLPELQAILDKCMLRRLKKDVLDLPDKLYVNDFVEMTQSQYKIYNSILEDLRQNIDKVKLSPNPLTMLIRLRQATGNPELLSTTAKGNPKYERMLDLVQEVVDSGSKAIVFSNWTDVLNPAYELLQKNGFNPALYTGLNKDTREEEKQRFKKDKSCKVICGTIGAMGTGLTLTEATTVIFLDEPWNRAIKDQAEDRAHRIGTVSNLTVITIMCKDSIDEKIHNIVYRKGKMSDIIVDKEEDLFKNPQVINYLLS